MLGDFNDEPFSVSVEQMMRARRDPESVSTTLRLPRARQRAVHAYLNRLPELYNPTWTLLAPRDGDPPGTYYYAGQWWLLDQLLMTPGALLSDRGVRYVPDSLRVFAQRRVPGPDGDVQLCTRNGHPRSFDARTGRGASDHLPLVFDIDVPA